MAITAITPATLATIVSGDSVAFTIDDTYTSLVIKVQTATALVNAYSTALGGGQSGYSVAVVDNGDGTHTVTTTADSGWDVSPQLIYVVEDETGTEATTSLSYTITGEAAFPQGKYPYNPTTESGVVYGPSGGTDNAVALFDGATGKLLKGIASLGTTGQVLTSNGAGAAPTMQSVSGTGDVVGPASATDDAIVVYDGTTGKLIKDSTGTIAQIIANTAKVTNATHTGDVTGSTALTIAAKAVDVAMLADGTDGELITWDAAGVAAVVAAGTATHVLTSNGAGAAPTFQVAASGSGDVVGPASATDDAIVVYDGTTGKLIKDSTGTIAQIVANTAKVTNATHTGDVTGATALTIAAGAVDVAMLAPGTDGELITWDAAGNPAVVAVGTATHVLTSNGVGAAPTFQAAASGTGDVVGPASATDDAIVVYDGTTGKLVKDSTGTIAQITANTAKTTNATHTGDVTGSTALTIGAKKVTAAMMEDGTDGELFTWDAAGVIAKVAVGTAGQVLTSNGVGAAPTMQTVAGTGDVVGPAAATDDAIVVYDGTTGKLIKDSTGTIAQIVANTAKVTNATHTGDVTGDTALTIAAKAVDVAMLADGTDGELITWNAAGVAAVVPVGTATHVLTSNGAGAAPTFQAPTGGGGAPVLPFEIFTRTQTADGGATPSAGQWDIKTGASGTPSGVTEIRLYEWTTGFGQDQSALLDTLGPGNFIKITKSGEAAEWAYYRLQQNADAGLYRILTVEHILNSSGFDFDQSSDYYFSTYYTGRSVPMHYVAHWECALPASTSQWVTYGGGGFYDVAFDTNVGTGPTVDYTTHGIHMCGDGSILGYKFAGYDAADSTTITPRPALVTKTAGTAVSTALTVNYIHGSAQVLNINTTNQWTELSQFNLTGTTSFSSGDEIIVVIKNTSASARTVHLTCSIFATHISLG